EPMAVDGNVTALELIVIIQLIKHHNPCMVFEIGTFDGRTTLNMAANCAEDAKVYTLDLPNEKRHGMKLPIEPCDALYINKELISLRYTGTEYSKKITQLYGDSARFDFSAFVNQIDFVFVDGSHSHEYALNDSLHALELLRDKRSVILWHDYDAWKGVTNALNKLYVDSPEFKGLKHIEGTSLVCLLRD
ncbi:MAG TPA: class I SAM-dependent methyltransferase, partial [Candidatus Hodarchaeales archaeon]|nr:class I SAM-dependent methyltransferase [Candidatus Hodarchaeales archaeon]